MKKTIVLLLTLFFGQAFYGQMDTLVTNVTDLNTPADDIACTPYQNRFIFASSFEKNYIDDFGNKKRHFYLYSSSPSKNNKEFSLKESIFNKIFTADVGTAFYEQNNHVLYFSSAYNFDQQKGNSLKIYWTSFNNGKWQPPKSFEFNSSKFNMAHPFLSKNGDQIFFSSDRPGGVGGMDIWYCNKINKKWSEPIWAGYTINTKGNEIFPTWYNGDLFFSSDGHLDDQGLDIYVADHKTSWEKVEKLKGKINSNLDDFQLIYLNNYQGYFSSNRLGGKGGDDIYYFEIAGKTDNKLDDYSLQLVCKGTPIRNASIVVTNQEDIVVTDGITDIQGSIRAQGMLAKKPYHVYVTGVEEAVLIKSVLNLLNENGDIIASYRFGLDGMFHFEYLPNDYTDDIPNIDDTDYSVLSIEMSGQIFNEQPGDVGEGVPVYITSKSGEILALAYTSSQGQFTAKELKPLKDYKFVIKGNNQIDNLNVNDKQSLKVIELSNNSGVYQRLLDENAISLLDENNNPIFVDKNEIFVIKEIYYKFDSDELNEIAKAQLRYLSLILENNPNIKIEIASHTDSRGTDEYNMNLSNRRAQVAAAYLESVGIEKSRLIPIGYGETRLKNHCGDNVECDEKLHAINRRTEIRIFTE